ncbi:TetR/AcrR family transcriptional regulator [Pseudoteredinibacter isoporae]|uniref:AcrR family transcriptional regulator n=1 Tax=Pseudoteredinibacter isoporae TaxID=570281 RepID=A0A7X0JQ94_9GAMM|nr:TetR/AcrR family transcriptional regulator [Pseudoteredinibacter isoporae]MBB6520235.1 AcrR family transcriptional regulator [Pseudoteredinibacter isoporae]NHO85807.1 TetR/AcrR family transcriptional regulator [Pseudoteredinibacter isoporae]NIB25741.1 TetR/AcrR family transcriptional regulator [Pseudoteredinibacter isoporae]
MKTLPTQKRALEKRKALIQAARVSFAECGYENTTAKTIAEAAGVATGTFYQNFENKDDLLRVIAQQKRDEIYQAVPGLSTQTVETEEQSRGGYSTEALFRQVLEIVYDYHESEAELHQVMEQRRFIDKDLDEILLRSENVMEEKVLAYVKAHNTSNPEAVAYNLFAMAEGLVHRHVFGKPNSSKEDTLELGAKMLACYFECDQH